MRNFWINLFTVFILVFISGQGAVMAQECLDCKVYKSQKFLFTVSPEHVVAFDIKFLEYLPNKADGTIDPNAVKTWKGELSVLSYNPGLPFLEARTALAAIEKQQAVIFADGKEVPVEWRDYFYLRENARVGTTVSFRSFDPQVQGGKVFDESGAPVTGRLGEVIVNNLSTETMRQLSTAKSIEIRVGGEKFTLTPEQMNEVNNVAKNAAAK